MGYHRCKFCGDNINGRQNLQAHRRQNHQAEMAPGKVFQHFSDCRGRSEQVDMVLKEWDERDNFLNNGMSHHWPNIRQMVENEHNREPYRGRDSELVGPKTREELLDELNSLYVEVIDAQREWFAWVHSPANTYTSLELVVLVIIWNGKDNVRPDDHKQLKDWMAKLPA